MREILEILYQISVPTFVSGSMIAMGLSLTVSEILRPLKNFLLIFRALLANFVAVPLFAFLLVHAFPLTLAVEEGIVLLALAAGAPFLPKLAYIARSDPALSIGLMLILMVATVFLMPLMLPWMLVGTRMDPWGISLSLIVTMLLPLLGALLLRRKRPELAKKLFPLFTRLGDLALVTLTVVLILLHYRAILGLWGWGVAGILFFLIGAIFIGRLFGGRTRAERFMLSIATAQRNISAAVLVAAQNFDDPIVTITMIAVAILGLFLMLPYAHHRKKQCRIELLEELESEKMGKSLR